MTTSTSTTTYTRVHTATYLTDVVMGAIGDILADLGIDTTRWEQDWEINEAALKNWIAEGSLDTVVLECHTPAGVVDPVIEFPVTYQLSGAGDGAFVASRARMARFLAKFKSVPPGTTHRIFCTFNGIRTPQPGWGPGARASTAGLQSTTFGTLGQAPHGTAAMRYLYG